MKTETKVAHTPGPWKAIPYGNTIDILDVAGTHFGLATIRPFGNRDSGIPTSVDACNARLIAAAPELLRILEAIDRFWGDGVCPAPVYPGAYLAEEDVPISDLVHLAVNRAKGIVRP